MATVRALKAHSGKYHVVAGRPLPPAMLAENPDDVHLGAANLRKQIENVRLHGVTPVVAINAFPGDFASEHDAIREIADSVGVRSRGLHPLRRRRPGRGRAGRGGRRGRGGARASSSFLYPAEAPLREKIETIATRVYGADGVDYSPLAARQLDSYERTGSARSRSASPRPSCRSRRPALKGAPTGWRLPVREVRASVGRRVHLPDLRRDADDAGPGLDLRRRAHRHR